MDTFHLVTQVDTDLHSTLIFRESKNKDRTILVVDLWRHQMEDTIYISRIEYMSLILYRLQQLQVYNVEENV